MTYLPVIDESACLAHGDCEQLAPDVFRVEDTAEVIGTTGAETLVQVAQACPAGAISVIDAETGVQLYP
jgi:ferredoxin